jgi:phosphoglycolate phosphatase
MSPRLAVWDIDGTLIDSRAVIFECCRTAMLQAGLAEPSYDAVRRIVGMSLKPALGLLAPSLDDPALERAVEAYKARFQHHRASGELAEPLYEGAEETLRRLKGEGWLLAVATGKSRRGVEAILSLHGWEGLFDTTHCADDGPGKPHPSMVLEAMRATGAAPERTIMIGDTTHDMQMARAAGAYAQGVSWGFHTAEEIRQAGAHHVAEDFASLNRQLDRFFKRMTGCVPAP